MNLQLVDLGEVFGTCCLQGEAAAPLDEPAARGPGRGLRNLFACLKLEAAAPQLQISELETFARVASTRWEVVDPLAPQTHSL